nr:immunoglobulin heavy chain junction region [Mus musculus]NSM05504.1 immunoglobulin heavy chain junction region [Mus musculus]NSM05539.1 immunoglobulin heavy chain junction region [Mus musculus]NSM06079.1 immunoglobulin heavy chain junction region [Mus musculus]NSM06419.1 immunoglobulin heavy chain junction region [Mus musculus]
CARDDGYYGAWFAYW